MNSLLERKTEAHLQESGLSFPKDLMRKSKTPDNGWRRRAV
jgi:hypothetical protein